MLNMLTMLLQLALASLAMAGPITIQGTDWRGPTGGGIVGFIILVLDIIVILEVLKSSRPVSHKLAWSLLIFLFPIGGIIIYWLFSNREAHNSGGYESIA